MLVILLSGIGCSLLNSVLASLFHIPVFVTTVAMMSVLSAIASQIITTKGGAVGGISIPSAVVKPMDTSVFKIIVLVIWVAVCIFIFNYTKFGRREKFVGGNPVCSELSGIKYNKYAILGFLIAGIGVGIGAFMTLVYTPSVTTTTAGGIKEIPNAIGCYVICGGLMGIVGFLNAARNTTINGGQLNFGSISIMFTAFLPMFIGSYISCFANEKIGFLLAALCMSMLNSTFAVFSNEVNASMQAIINAVLLVVFFNLPQ